MTPTPYVKQTWIDGDSTKPVSAARMGVIETGVFDAHYRPSVAVYRSAVQTLTTGVATILLWDTELYDTDSMHSTVSNTGRLIAPVAGKYLITANIGFAANATGVRLLSARVNGTTTIDNAGEYAPNGSNVNWLRVSRIYSLAASDYVELLGNQSSGGNLNTASGIPDMHFEMTLVSY